MNKLPIHFASFYCPLKGTSPSNLPEICPDVSQRFFHIWVCPHTRIFSNVLRHDDKSNPNRQFLLFCMFFPQTNPTFLSISVGQIQTSSWYNTSVGCIPKLIASIIQTTHMFSTWNTKSRFFWLIKLISILVPWQIWSSIVLMSTWTKWNTLKHGVTPNIVERNIIFMTQQKNWIVRHLTHKILQTLDSIDK